MSEPHPPDGERESMDNAGLPPMNWGGKAPIDEPFPDETLEPAKSNRRRWLLIAIAAVLAILGAVIAGMAVLPHLPPLLRTMLPGEPSANASLQGLTDRVAGLEQRLDDLGARLTRSRSDLEGRIAANTSVLDMLQQKERPAGAGADEALERRLTALEGEIRALQAAPPATGAALPAPAAAPPEPATAGPAVTALTDALDRRIGLLEQSMAAESRQRATGAERLSERLTALASASSGSAKRVGLVLAIQRLSRSTAGAEGFADDLKLVHALAADDVFAAPLATLQRYAPTGVPTEQQLRSSFDVLAATVVRTAMVPDTASWWQRALRRLASLVLVRRVGEVPGSSPDAVVARTEQRLKAGDLAGAVQQLKTLDGAAAKAAGGWISDAEGRLAVETAVARLRDAAVAQLADSGQAPQ